MVTVSKRVKWIALIYVVTSIWWGPAAEAAFHLDYAPGVERKGIAPALVDQTAPITGIVTAAPEAPPAAPSPWQVSGRSAALPVRIVAPAASRTGSTNRFVSPWGCEADTAQDWSPSGKYWGKYQFDRDTWAAHGGDPSHYGSAPESEQDEVASRVTYDAWPNC